MNVSEIASSLGMGVRQFKVSIFAADLLAFTTAGAKSFDITGVGGSGFLSAVNNGKLYIPQAGKVLGVQQHLVTPFSGGTLSAVTCSVGKSGGSTTFLAAAFDVFQAAGDTVVQETALFKSGQNSAWPVNVTFTPTGDVLGNATAGQVDIYIVLLSTTTANNPVTANNP